MVVNRTKEALVIVDMQYDFIDGSLAVPGASQIILPIEKLAAEFDTVIATQDWHPADHSSFKSFGGPWPSHCVQGTRGAELHSVIARLNGVSLIARKGMNVLRDSYSAFRDNNGPETGVMGYLLRRGIKRTYFVGLARDFCVKWSAEDASTLGMEAFLVWDMTRSVFPENDNVVNIDLVTKGVTIV